jgi:hypothetical protein
VSRWLTKRLPGELPGTYAGRIAIADPEAMAGGEYSGHRAVTAYVNC